jgi:hypothetical protein
MGKVTVNVEVDDRQEDASISAKLEGFSLSAVKMSLPVFIAEKRHMAELHKGGIYFQIGSDRDEQGRIKIYIGECHDFIERFASHRSQRTGLHDWTTAIFFIDGSLGKEFRLLLEDALCEMVRNSSNWQLVTEQTTKGNVVGRESQIKRCVDQIWLLSRALGYDFIMPTENHGADIDANVPIFECKSPKRHAEAKGFLSANGFTICAGAIFSDKILPNMKPIGYRRMREAIERDREMVHGRKLLKDKEFSNSSIAAAVVLGTTANGYDRWKTRDGLKLGDYLDGIDVT